jgi:hypothetical protein
MKNIICIFLIALSASSLSAQRNGRDQTLFSNSGRAGFFISSMSEFSGLNKDFLYSSGGGFGFILGDFFLGGYGIGTGKRHHFRFDEGMEFGQGGFWTGFAFPQSQAVHGFASLKAGWGALNLDFDDEDLRYDNEFFALTPEAGLEVNIFRFLRLSGTVGYRFMNEISDTPPSSLANYEGLTASVNLRIGFFGRDRRR